MAALRHGEYARRSRAVLPALPLPGSLVVTSHTTGPALWRIARDTVIVMFLVAFLCGSATPSRFLHSARRDERRAGAASPFQPCLTIEYRTVFLSWFALPLLEANGFGRLASVLYFFARIAAVRVRPDCNVPMAWACYGYGTYLQQPHDCPGYAAIVALAVPAPGRVLRAVHHACHLLHHPGLWLQRSRRCHRDTPA